jgi:hypothetical protein
MSLRISTIIMVFLIGSIFFAGKPQPSSAQNEGFASYQLLVFCESSSVASATFWVNATEGGTVGRPRMGLKTVCAGKKCGGGPVTLAQALAQLPANVSSAMQSKVDSYQEKLGQEGSFLACLGINKEKPPDTKCDTKKACEKIAAVDTLITEYEGLIGLLPGSFAEFNGKLSRLLMELSEALACRFNEGHDAADSAVLNDFLGQVLRDKNGFQTLTSQAKVPQAISCNTELSRSGSAECSDHQAIRRIKDNLATLGSAIGCSGPPKAVPPAKAGCKELSNGVLDGLTTYFKELDKLKGGNRPPGSDSYDQVADGLEAALDQLQDAAEEIEGAGGTGAQQYKDIQGKIAKLRKLLDVWGKMKAASCLPPDVEQLLRRLAQEKRAGTEHKATCTELCAATADWYVDITGLSAQRGTFFKACTLACF